MKITQNKILLWIFVVSTLINGIVPEAIGWGVLFILFYNHRRYRKIETYSTYSFENTLLLVLIIIFYIVQIAELHLSTSESIRLYGITKTVVAFVLVRILLGPMISQDDIIADIFPLMLIINIYALVVILLKGDAATVLGGSRNYIGAIDVVLIPYVLRFMPLEKKKSRAVWLIVTFALTIFSGSRSMLLAAIIAVAATAILREGLQRKIKYMILFVIVALLAVMFGGIFNNVGGFSRAFSVFNGFSDQARSDLFDSFVVQYGQYSDLEKLIGSGNNLIVWRGAPPHNFALEMLLCFGKIGLALFLVVTIITAIRFLKHKKKYTCLIIGLAIMINLVQPFITTGYLFQVMMSIVCLTIYTKE